MAKKATKKVSALAVPVQNSAKKKFPSITAAAEWCISEGLSSATRAQSITRNISKAHIEGTTAYGLKWKRI